MDFDLRPIELGPAFGNWVLIVIVFGLICLFVGLAVSMLAAGLKGPGMVAEVLFRGVRDLFGMKLQRIGAVTQLVFRESVPRKRCGSEPSSFCCLCSDTGSWPVTRSRPPRSGTLCS